MMRNTALRAFLSALGHVEAGGVTEVCIFQGGKKPTHVGYFDNLESAAKAIEAYDGRGNIFVTLNPAKRDLLARANNHLAEGSYKNPIERTKDHEIHRDSWFLLDVDPKRPSGISSTDDEKREALEVAKAARNWLLSVGVPASAILTGDSGNGAYVLVRLPDYELTDERKGIKKALVNFVADKFDTGRVEIDRSVFNPARLIGALGAMKVKGENITERPHRRSSVRTVAGESFDPTKEQRCEPFDLYALAAKVLPTDDQPSKKKSGGSRPASGNGAGRLLFDARTIADKLQNPKPTDRGYIYYDCPSCGNPGKFWVEEANGKHGCFEPASVCDWRQLNAKLRELAGAVPGWAPSDADNASQRKTDVESVLGRIVTAQAILSTNYPEPKWAVKGIIPEGTTFIAGPPKLGKSIYALNIAVAVAEGGRALSCFDVERGAVLYLALEDGPRRLQKRLLKLTSGKLSDKLEILTECPRLDQGGLDVINAWIERHDDARLLIVDTLKMLRPLAAGRDKNAYDSDYEAIAPLTNLASERIALCIVHHTRKAKDDDPLATVSGSYGLTGAADGVLVLSRRRNRTDATLSVIGRDVEEQEFALEFKPDMCLWSVLGKSEEVRRSGERQEILDLLAETGELMAPKVIADLLDKQQTSTRTLLYKMRQAGEIKAFGNRYQLPDFEPPAPSVPSVPRAKKTGNAPKVQKTEVLPQNVPSVPSVPSNSQEQPQNAETGNCDKVGTLGTFSDNSNANNGLGAFPVKNVPGNAGNVSTQKPLADALRKKEKPRPPWSLPVEAEGVEPSDEAAEGVEKNNAQRLQATHSDKSSSGNGLAEGVEDNSFQRLQRVPSPGSTPSAAEMPSSNHAGRRRVSI
jgi:hypothetical protein